MALAGTDNDFTDLHAWGECICPARAVFGFDSTSGLLAGVRSHPACATPDSTERALEVTRVEEAS